MAILGRARAARNKKKQKISVQDLRVFNLVAAVVCIVQGILILLLASAQKSSQPIVTGFLAQDNAATKAQGQEVYSSATRLLLDLNLAYLVAAFLIIGGLVYLLTATFYRASYESDLREGFNKFKWFDLSISLGLVTVAVGILSGVADISSLIMIFFLSLVLGAAGALADKYSRQTKSVKWWTYLEGVKYALVPWLVIIIYMVGSIVYGSALPTFLYFVYISFLLLFGALLVNLYLSLRKMGHWENELFGEKTYIVLAVVFKTVLAWQIFAGALR